jgi:tetratricopeptide (TPR) repeat protein
MVRKSIGRKLAAAALFTAALSGCKNGIGIPIWNPFAKPDKAALHQDSDGGHWQDETVQPRESGLTKSFKKIGETVSKPFKKNPEAETSPPEDESLIPASKNASLGPDFYVSLARMEAKAGRVKTAVEQYQKALDADPKHVNALLGLARLYDREGDSAKAFEYYRRAVKADPENGTALNDLGLCYARNEMLDESIATLQKAVSIEPEHKLYRNNLATVLVEGGRAQEALRTLVPVHGQAVAHYNIGFLLDHCNRKAEALEHFEAAVELDPTLVQAQKWVAILRKQNPEAAPPASTVERRAPATHTPGPLARATEAVDAVDLSSAPPAGRQSASVETDAAPLDAPIATPYVPQSDIAPKAKPISRSTVVEQAEPRPALKPTGRMPPMDPHQVPRVEIPPRPSAGAAPGTETDEVPDDELIGPKLMQKRPTTGDRYEVVGPSAPQPMPRSPARSQPAGLVRAPTTSDRLSPGAAATPPLPEQVSTLPEETLTEPTTTMPSSPSAPKARTATGGARYPASRY